MNIQKCFFLEINAFMQSRVGSVFLAIEDTLPDTAPISWFQMRTATAPHHEETPLDIYSGRIIVRIVSSASRALS